ncbi:MAG: proprotein convertase P-domain-containing protein, partial [Luteitalea sp.]
MAVAAVLPVAAATPPVALHCAPATTTTSSNTAAAAVPNSGTLVRTVTVSGAAPFLWDLDVLLGVTHTFPADLDVTLTSPAGTVVTLTTDNGGAFDNVFNGTRFDDQAGTPVTDVVFANNVVVTAAAPEQPLARFYGENPNGVWTLQITDDLANADAGAFSTVSLVIAAVPELPVDVLRRVVVAPGTSITDNSSIASTQTVRGGGRTIVGLRVRTFITHTYAADLDVTLTSPSGTVVTMTTDNGGSSDNVFNGTVWDDRTGAPATDFVYANLVVATPLAPEEAFAAFIGEPPNGVWTLTVADDAAGDVGTLASWELDVLTGSCARVPPAPPGFAAPITTTFANTTPAPIPVVGTSGTTTSTLVVSGAGPSLWDLDVLTSIRHTFNADLDVTLTSPAGTVVTLTTDNGGGADNVFNGTRWDDQADLPVSDATFVNLQARPALVPEGALGAFVGENPNGTWTLTIVDDAAPDVGTLDAWSVRVRTLTGAPGTSTVTLPDATPGAIPDGSQNGLVRTRTVAGVGTFLT